MELFESWALSLIVFLPMVGALVALAIPKEAGRSGEAVDAPGERRDPAVGGGGRRPFRLRSGQ